MLPIAVLQIAEQKMFLIVLPTQTVFVDHLIGIFYTCVHEIS
jgi:hypothetical protein